MVMTAITDTGSGISQEILGRIFDPFFTTKEVGKGTGLGLSVCLGLINKHNGAIKAQSEAGKGSTFTISLPV
jgi:signal transduction histidine kinase